MHFWWGGGGRGDDDDTVTQTPRAKFSRRAGLLGIYSTFVMSDHLIYSPNLLLNFEEEQRATHGRPVWAVKNRGDALGGGPAHQTSPRYPVFARARGPRSRPRDWLEPASQGLGLASVVGSS